VISDKDNVEVVLSDEIILQQIFCLLTVKFGTPVIIKPVTSGTVNPGTPVTI